MIPGAKRLEPTEYRFPRMSTPSNDMSGDRTFHQDQSMYPSRRNTRNTCVSLDDWCNFSGVCSAGTLGTGSSSFLQTRICVIWVSRDTQENRYRYAEWLKRDSNKHTVFTIVLGYFKAFSKPADLMQMCMFMCVFQLSKMWCSKPTSRGAPLKARTYEWVFDLGFDIYMGFYK